MHEAMKQYYAQRAPYYDSIYQKEERQEDLQSARTWLIHALQGKHILELACGTGYWTDALAPAATSILATDINQEMLDLASIKLAKHARVSLASADAFDLAHESAISGKDLNACFAGFLWSHIKREDQHDFLVQLRSVLGAGSALVLIDNRYVEGESAPIARTDLQNNTYQIRVQEDGQRVEIVKNFPTDSFLRKKLANFARDIRVERNHYFWMLSCVLK
jgi:SAM-dependent methyltransferase